MRAVIVVASLVLAFAFVAVNGLGIVDFPPSDSSVPELASAFLVYVSKFSKQYNTVEEYNAAFQNYVNSIKRVENLRVKHQRETGEDGTAIYGLTKFSDLSHEDFKSRFLGYKPAGNRASVAVAPAAVSSVPPSVDWRTKGAVTPVKDQGQCGSCWAFSATEEVESRYFMQHNSLRKLSVQQIVSCDTNDAGCDGGDTISAYEYIQDAGGLELDSEYPYSSGDGDDGSCDENSSDFVVSVSSYSYATTPCYGSCNSQNETELAASVATLGPISICVDAETWDSYNSGILKSGCPKAYSDLDHCVQIVGYDMSASTPYWIVRNSWNTDWGENGYIRIAIGKNLCGIADEATYVSTSSV